MDLDKLDLLTLVDDDKFEIDLDGVPPHWYFVDPNAVTKPIWIDPVCECGSWATYGKECSHQMHADYCPVKKFHYGRRK